MKNNLFVAIVGLFIFYTFAITLGIKAVEKRDFYHKIEVPDSLTRIPGTGVFINIPPSFIQDYTSFSRFVQPEISVISADRIQNDVEVILPGASWDFYQEREGHTLVVEKEIEIDGLKGLYLETIYADVRTIQITVGNKEQTFRIFGWCQALDTKAKQELYNIHSSISIDKDYPVPWQDLSGFQLSGRYKDLKPFEYYSNRFEFQLDEKLEILVMRVSGTTSHRGITHRELLDYVGEHSRSGLEAETNPIPMDTIINGNNTILLEIKGTENGENIQLVQCIIRGKMQTIFLNCRLHGSLDEGRKKLFQFMSSMELD